MSQKIIRCDWANSSKAMQDYHDNEWGIPVHDDQQLFKMLCLEGMQAGLSWSTILNKREALCLAFDDFKPQTVVDFGAEKIEELMQNSGIIRNRLKINSVVTNAKAYFELCKQHHSLDEFLWKYVENKPIDNCFENCECIPATSKISDSISKDLKKLGFKFVGSTIMYAFMQSVGMVNDHICSCSFRAPKKSA